MVSRLREGFRGERRVSGGSHLAILSMKSSPLLAAALFALSQLAASAQTQPGIPSPARRLPQASADLKRFDLDFPGGTPDELVATISKAQGRHLNVIIPVAQAQTKIMPIKVVGVTVNELFIAIQMASARTIPLISGNTVNPGGHRTSQVQYRDTSITFQPSSSPITDETVWSFNSSTPTAEEQAVFARMSEPDQVCQYFQLSPYLDDHTIEDITTAVETGWKMLGVEPTPKLSFHAETKLLIAVGSSELVAQIPAVLKQLAEDQSGLEDKIANAMAETKALKEAKAPGWEQKAEEVEARVKRLVERQVARKELQNLLQQAERPPPGVIPKPPK